MKSVITALLILLLAQNSFASGSRVGNGGAGVVCGDNGKTQLLDLYEATAVSGRVVYDDYWDQRSEAEHTAAYTNRLQQIMGSGHPIMRVLSETALLRATAVLSEGPLRITTDAGLLTKLKSGCHLTQVAARGEGPLSGKLEVLGSFWRAATAQERALLMIHEALHSWFSSELSREQSARDFVGTLALRQVVGLLYTDSFTYPQTEARIRRLIETREPLDPASLTHDSLQ